MDAGTIGSSTLKAPLDAMDGHVAIFVLLRRVRSDRAGLEKIASELSRLAGALHRKADAEDELREAGVVDGDPRTRRLASVIVECVQVEDSTELVLRRNEQSPTVQQLRRKLMNQHPSRNEEPAALHRRASALARVAGHISDALESADLIANSLRESGPVGQHPDVAMHVLMTWAVAAEANLAELSRRIARRGVRPDRRGVTEPDLAVRWHDILRQAKARFVRRWCSGECDVTSRSDVSGPAGLGVGGP